MSAPVPLFAPHFNLLHWLKTLGHWPRALNDLIDGRSTAKLLKTHDLRIHFSETPMPPEPTHQASLLFTFQHLGFQTDEQQTKARRRLRELVKMPKSLLKKSIDWPVEWETAFVGRVHAEAHLVCLANEEGGIIQNPFKRIGTSKRRCYCCSHFLEYVNSEFKTSGSHGKVYGWTPPMSAPSEAKNQLLEDLRSRVLAYLNASEAPEDSSSGFEVGSPIVTSARRAGDRGRASLPAGLRASSNLTLQSEVRAGTR